MFNLEDSGELLVVSKALNFVRFNNKEYDSRYLAASEILVELHIRIISKLNEYAKTKGIDVPSDFENIENLPEFIETIKSHISHIDDWSDFNIDQKRDIINLFIKPYKYLNSTLISLIDFGDEFHKNS